MEQKYIKEWVNENSMSDNSIYNYDDKIILDSYVTTSVSSGVPRIHNFSSENIFNIITAGDFGCSPRAQENIKEIELKDPELFLALGDLSYKKTPDCWFQMTENIDNKTKIAIGNHESAEDLEIENQRHL